MLQNTAEVLTRIESANPRVYDLLEISIAALALNITLPSQGISSRYNSKIRFLLTPDSRAKYELNIQNRQKGYSEEYTLKRKLVGVIIAGSGFAYISETLDHTVLALLIVIMFLGPSFILMLIVQVFSASKEIDDEYIDSFENISKGIMSPEKALLMQEALMSLGSYLISSELVGLTDNMKQEIQNLRDDVIRLCKDI